MNLFSNRLFFPLLTLLVILAGSAAALETSAPKGTTEKVQTDPAGKTVQYVDAQGRVLRSVRQDLRGPELGRVTVTDYQYNGKGQVTAATVANQLMTRQETYNTKGQVENAVQDDLFGVEWGRHRVFDEYQYKKDHLVRNRETSELETAVHHYDEQGHRIKSEIERKTGLGAQRKTVITTTYDKKTGSPLSQTETNDYGVITTTAFDQELLLPAKQEAKYKFGLGSTRETSIQYVRDKQTGLPLQCTEKNAYGVTRKYYDTAEKGTFGIVVGSDSETNFGLESTRKTWSVIQSDQRHGLTRATKSDNGYETVWTIYDAFNDGLFGVPQKIETKRKFGLGVKRHTITLVEANTFNGLFKHTKEIQSPDGKKDAPKKAAEKPMKKKTK